MTEFHPYFSSDDDSNSFSSSLSLCDLSSLNSAPSSSTDLEDLSPPENRAKPRMQTQERKATHVKGKYYKIARLQTNSCQSCKPDGIQVV
jgi:hypothetical protein